MRRADGLSETRTAAVERRHGRFRSFGPTSARPVCLGAGGFGLDRPVFGGTGNISAALGIRAGVPVVVSVELRRGRRVLRRLVTRRAVDAAGVRVALNPRGLRRGDYTVRVTLQSTGARVVRTFRARRV
jgi:hypothetical protein